MERVLRDPESARYKFEEPHTAYANHGLVKGGGIRWTGYRVQFSVNATNGFGGYTGYKPYMALFTNNEVITVLEGYTHPLVTSAGVK